MTLPMQTDLFGEPVANVVSITKGRRAKAKPANIKIAVEDDSTPPGDEQAVRATPFRFVDPATIPPRQFLYGRHLIRQFVSATIAPGGVGKSLLAITEALAMTSGRNLVGMTLPHVGRLRVWYLGLEDPREEIERQIGAACLYYGLASEDLGNRLFVDSGREQRFVIAKQERSGATIVEPVYDSLRQEIRSREIDVLIVDPTVSAHAVSENDNGAIDTVVKAFGRLAGECNCAVHLIHHVRKVGAFEVDTESARGAKAFTDGARSVRTINRMTNEEARRASVDEPRRYIRTYSDKTNVAPPAAFSDWYFIASVDLPNGDNGPGDSVGVVTKWQWPTAGSDLSLLDVRTAQDAIAGGDWKAHPTAENWAGLAIAEALSIDVDDPVNRQKVKDLIKRWEREGHLKEVRKQDARRKVSPHIEVGKLVQP